MSSVQDQDESLVVGRPQRRSAAAKNKAWSALMGSGKHKGEEEEEQPEAPVTQRSTPRQVPRKKQKVETKPKNESVSPPKPIAEKKSPLIPAQAPRLFSQASKTSKPTENGAKSTAAFGKEEIGDIEKEMFKTYMSNESEGFTESDGSSMQDLLDEDDEDFVAKPKRTYTKRGTAATRSNIRRGGLKAPTFASRPAANFSQRPMQNMMVSRNDGPPQLNSRFVVRPPTLKYASSAAVGVYENRPIKTIVLRKNEVYGNGNDGPRDSPRVPMTISSMSLQSNKQIEEINKKFGARVVAGDSVQKFNGLIETLVNELKLMAEDRERMVRNHQELTEQMNLSHSTALDIKDSRIRQLENCVSKLQDQMAQLVNNLQSSYAQHESSEKKPDEEGTDKDEMEE